MKRSKLKSLIKENISDWLKERAEEYNVSKVSDISTVTEAKSKFDDKLTKDGKVYLVKKPTKNMTEGNMIYSEYLYELVGEEYMGAYSTKERAVSAGKKLLKERDAKLKETYKKGQEKVKTLESTISELKSQIESKMQEAVSNPEMRESLQTESDTLLEKLTTLEAQVERLKDALETENIRLEKKGKKKDKLASRADKEDDSKKED